MTFLAYAARGHFSVSSDTVLECLRRLGRGRKPGKPLALVCEQYEKTAANASFPVRISPISNSTGTVREDRPSCPG